jgi:hypothetical protein
MNLKKAILIAAPCDAVWEYVGSPEIWPLFHVKAGECERISSQADEIGSVYQIEFRLGSKTSLTRCEIVEYRIGRLITVKSSLPKSEDHRGRQRSARVTYELQDRGRETRVTERIDLSGSGMGLILQAVVWLIYQVGTPTGEATLMRLKRIVEE